MRVSFAKPLLVLVMALSLPVGSVWAWGRIAFTRVEAQLYRAPDARSPVVRQVPPGREILVDGPVQPGWWAVFRPGETEREMSRSLGYIHQSQLTSQRPPDEENVQAPPTQVVLPPSGTDGGPVELLPFQVLGVSEDDRANFISVRMVVRPKSERNLSGVQETMERAWEDALRKTQLDRGTLRASVYVYLEGMDLDGNPFAMARADRRGLADVIILPPPPE
ncbi:MAG: hypothetical protein K9N49_07500 [Candidatus Marinimicrobia bacterium]|nr:hypothetical protein [Candidatus Neomarinimicrobiota bacterium]